MQESYGTLSETINGLRKEGYLLDFNINQEQVAHPESNISLSPDDFEIDKVFRFEGESNPDDESVLYAISAPAYSVKGLLVNAYGLYADKATNALIDKLKTHH